MKKSYRPKWYVWLLCLNLVCVGAFMSQECEWRFLANATIPLAIAVVVATVWLAVEDQHKESAARQGMTKKEGNDEQT